MACVLPIFITVILGIIEMGRAIMVGQLVTNAAREAVRVAVLDGSSNSQVTAAAQTFLQSTAGVGAGSVTVGITAEGGGDVADAETRDLITVTVSVPYSAVSFLPPNFMAGQSLTATSAMRHE
jgi:Flp pilus assembly protein TadG